MWPKKKQVAVKSDADDACNPVQILMPDFNEWHRTLAAVRGNTSNVDLLLNGTHGALFREIEFPFQLSPTPSRTWTMQFSKAWDRFYRGHSRPYCYGNKIVIKAYPEELVCRVQMARIAIVEANRISLPEAQIESVRASAWDRAKKALAKFDDERNRNASRPELEREFSEILKGIVQAEIEMVLPRLEDEFCR